ncbi:integrase-like protein [Rhodovulum kholense]|uniref:Integrase-like protein n=1 Tax=Rhodovulum kholense TaxID=453584 RepID=A0A8E2VKH4_9RHOB|nr:integrase-like protein [Rhodovulum kholense]
MRSQTNGMVERFNGRIEDVLQSHRVQSGEDLEQTLLRYVPLYNKQLPQSVLKGQTPVGPLSDWQRHRPGAVQPANSVAKIFPEPVDLMHALMQDRDDTDIAVG